jgi:predicted nucleotidyltransferase component of viral defense system
MLHFEAIPVALAELLRLLGPLAAMQDFALGGGTSLTLRFGHRWSVDLDFFTTSEFDAESLFENLGLHDATITGRARNSITLDTCGVKLDFLRHAYPALRSVETIGGVRLISLPDVAAMKLNALANRGSKKDFYDLAELLENFTIHQMLDFFSQKYLATDPFTVIRSLAWFDDAELEPDPVDLKGRDWTSVKNVTLKAVAEL